MIITLFNEIEKLKKENANLKTYNDGSLAKSLTRIGNMLGLKGRMYTDFGYKQIEEKVKFLLGE